MSKDILVIGDAHARVDDDLSRFKALGKFITKRQPDIIVSIGDFADMASLSSFDSALSKARVTGDYQSEVKSVHKALQELWRPLGKLQDTQRKNKKKQYSPKTIITVGNHEARYDKVIQQDPIILEGTIGMEDLDYESYFDVVVPFKEIHYEQGVGFVHYLSNLMGRPVGGTVNPANGILNQARTSITVGHSHLWNHTVRTKATGQRVHGLVCGCFIGTRDQHKHHLYAKGSSINWIDGVTMLNNAEDGDYDIEFISTENLLEEFIK